MNVITVYMIGPKMINCWPSSNDKSRLGISSLSELGILNKGFLLFREIGMSSE